MGKSSSARTGPKILRRTFLSNTLKAAASIKKHEEIKCLIKYKFCRTREISATQLPIETIVAPVSRSDPVFCLQTNIIFDGKKGAKIDSLIQ